MAQITSLYKELVESHSTEEVLACIYQMLALAKVESTPVDGAISKDMLMLSAESSRGAYEILKALMEKLDILDDTPTVVA